MDKLELLFREIRGINRFAIPEYVNMDNNYFYFRISNGHITEVLISNLVEFDIIDIRFEASRILSNY